MNTHPWERFDYDNPRLRDIVERLTETFKVFASPSMAVLSGSLSLVTTGNNIISVLNTLSLPLDPENPRSWLPLSMGRRPQGFDGRLRHDGGEHPQTQGHS